MSRGSRVHRAGLKLTTSMAVLIGLATPAAVRAQSGDNRIVAPGGYHDLVESRNDPNTPVIQMRGDADMPSIELVGDARREGLCSNPFASDSGLSSATIFFQHTHSTSSSTRSPLPPEGSSDEGGDKADGYPNSTTAVVRVSRPDLGRSIYYKNKIEFSLDGGWLPINIPFVFDVFLGDGYTMTNLRYTLVPIVASVRWQVDDVGGPWVFRGNWDIEASAAVTLIPRGPESRYIAWIMGFRRNFVPRRGRIAPYFDGRLGLGNIDAKEPLGVLYAQGQDFTFTMNMGSGVRYNFNSRYSISAGLNWMHISNLYLSEPKFANYGINVYGPMFGVNVRLGRLGHRGSE